MLTLIFNSIRYAQEMRMAKNADGAYETPIILAKDSSKFRKTDIINVKNPISSHTSEYFSRSIRSLPIRNAETMMIRLKATPIN
jgi:hypothetical protein